MKQHVPPASVCDYLMVDVPQSPNGSYNQWSYSFLLQRNTSGHRFLFTVDMSGVNMVAKIRAIQSANFDQGTMQLQHSLWPGRLVGYGTLHGWTIPHTQRDYTTSKNLLELIYKRFAQAIQSSGIDEKDVTNFFAFKPRVNRTTNIDYVNFVNMLNELNNLRLVIMLTISDEDQLVVMPSSAWNHVCQPLNDEPLMSTAVGLIADIANPKVTFTLTISLRLDIFHDVSLAVLSDYSLPRVNSNGHDAVFFSTQCERQLFGRDPTGSSILDVRDGSCAFAWGPSQQSEVITFETPRTIRTKMVATYHKLGYTRTKTYVVGWTVYNVTLGLAPASCNGSSNRLNAIRKIVDENNIQQVQSPHRSSGITAGESSAEGSRSSGCGVRPKRTGQRIPATRHRVRHERRLQGGHGMHGGPKGLGCTRTQGGQSARTTYDLLQERATTSRLMTPSVCGPKCSDAPCQRTWL
ncbi:uncharacterized protein LOC119164994 [Rhipicephalus microplus]|uniref:uncharacterized protein LOC119164994 n=1 Tax=Rhipicephalus microplus TaxID=6941 RepID=UPI003F6D79BC